MTEFTWKEKTYKFDLDVGIVLIAISPQGFPVLVSEGDYWNLIGKYPCTTPLYIQFIPDITGRIWTWLPKIEPWLFNLETNRLFEIPTPAEATRRITIVERELRNAPGLVNSRSRRMINLAHTGDLCKIK